MKVVEVFGDDFLDGDLVVFAGEFGSGGECFEAGFAVEAVGFITKAGEGHGEVPEFVDGRFLGVDAGLEGGDGLWGVQSPGEVFGGFGPSGGRAEFCGHQIEIGGGFFAGGGDADGFEVITVVTVVAGE